MDSSNVIKVIGAFAGGIVLTLGGVLIYQKTTTMAHPEQQQAQVAQAPATPAAQQPPPAEEQAAPPAEQQAQPTPEPEAPPAPKPVNKPVAKKPKAPVHNSDADAYQPPAQPAPQDAQVAQNQAGSQPPDNGAAAQNPPAPPPPPSRAINEPQPAPPPAPRQPMTVTLAAGTTIPIRLSETLSTDNNYTGDTFRAVLDQPIISNGFVIAEKGSKVLGRIVQAEKAGRVKGVSTLTLALTEINTTDGQKISIETSPWSRQGATSHKRDAAEIGGGAALGAIIGALAGGGKGAAIGAGAGGAAGTGVALGTRGKAEVVPIETHITFSLQNPITITEKMS